MERRSCRKKSPDDAQDRIKDNGGEGEVEWWIRSKELEEKCLNLDATHYADKKNQKKKCSGLQTA